ncbi:MAG: flagellar hook-basal body complex protein FliE [Lachnospiraceae bacterium]|nr:flagellar hook-basal body complex protein FliE [Lachnospiraceae bacterium]MBQ8548909.1 flagellar hook-basal body complex protein FliE [Lachnospiraceae bacterium]
MSLIAPINKIQPLDSGFQVNPVKETSEKSGAFEALYQSAIGLLEETNRYTHEAEEAQMSYMLGLNDNVHDLLIAQNKANISLQYTVAIRNGVLEAYKELMAMQF